MSEYCFFAPDAMRLAEHSGIQQSIIDFAESNKKQTYVLHKALSKENSTYEYDDALIIFSLGTSPCFVDIGDDKEAFDDYKSDFIDDVNYLSEKFKYVEKIGRRKHWAKSFKSQSVSDLNLKKLALADASEKRYVDLITSLVIGSINDVAKMNLEPNNILDLVKSKIVLFDTDQTSFVFRSGRGKRYVIQGLAGSGKTELLLHKMKEIYSNDDKAKIAFTCFNKILASSMRNRIPNFFDFMRVDRQIDWDNKLFCFHAWGSTNKNASGMYRYICHFYSIPFGTLQAGGFDMLCKRAIKEISEKPLDNNFAFDYVFIDESQDFAESFMALCELVTKKRVFVAGDVFQNIFRSIDVSVSKADLVLRKCYRTDPKNLMFSHALGMGLFEKPVLRWLKTHEWEACGYHYNESNGRAKVMRDPLRRFEDIPQDYECTKIHQVLRLETISDSIIKVIKDIKSRHDTVCQSDIAVLFLDKQDYIYEVIPDLEKAINTEFGWEVNISFRTKTSDLDRLFISNINNAKGLEFPFVICFALELRRQKSFRNALYTMMARSFLESHLIVNNSDQSEMMDDINSGLKLMNKSGYMDLRIPTDKELANQKDLIVLDEQHSIEAYVQSFCKGKNATPRLYAKLVSRMTTIIGDDEYTDLEINSFLEIEYNRNLKL
jgi:superfamily I DNA and RNA helicase